MIVDTRVVGLGRVVLDPAPVEPSRRGRLVPPNVFRRQGGLEVVWRLVSGDLLRRVSVSKLPAASIASLSVSGLMALTLPLMLELRPRQ